MSYRWKRNGVVIVGATSPTYSIGVTTLADNGSTFVVEVVNPAGTLISTSASLTVTP